LWRVNGFGQRPAREAERGGADGRTEDIERRHRDLETFARLPQTIFNRNPRAVERKRRERMRRDHLDALRNRQSGRIGINHERRQPLGARAFAGAGEHDVEVRDAAVGDPGLAAVEPHVIVAVRPRRHRERRDVGTCFRLGECKGGDRVAGCDRAKVALLERFGPEQGDGAGA
jgi:hypothetical protein